MFTGIIEEVGTIVAVERADATAQDVRMTIQATGVLDGTCRGDSIATNGVCLTVTHMTDDSFSVDVMPETVRLTTLGDLRVGSHVNLERAARIDSRLDGHIVQGHVDGMARVARIATGPRWTDITFDVEKELLRYIARKGSITINGTSLTVTAVTDTGFGVSLIPTTLSETTLGELAEGDNVNIETDVVAKYVESLLLHSGGVGIVAGATDAGATGVGAGADGAGVGADGLNANGASDARDVTTAQDTQASSTTPNTSTLSTSQEIHHD